MWGHASQFSRGRTARKLLPMVAMFGLLSLAIYFYGWPLDAFTWIALAFVLACSALPGLWNLRWRWAAIVLLLGVYIAFPGPFLLIPGFERWALCDDHGGRRGLILSPGLRFGRDGPNTELLESYLGPLPANWWQQYPLFPGIRDGNERVQSRNPILRKELPEMLSRLPNDAARRQVLECLVDTENRLRVHQGLLLACLTELGYPPGLDADSWWQAHRDLFRVEHDAMAAAKMTRGWMRRIHRLTYDLWGAVGTLVNAANYQERGQWGGHEDFGEAVWKLEWPNGKHQVMDTDNVVWWPSAPEAMFGTGRIDDAWLIRVASDGAAGSRLPLNYRHTDPEWIFHDTVIEPHPDTWPLFGKMTFKLDGQANAVDIYEISHDELAVRVGEEVFRGLKKTKLVQAFKE